MNKLWNQSCIAVISTHTNWKLHLKSHGIAHPTGLADMSEEVHWVANWHHIVCCTLKTFCHFFSAVIRCGQKNSSRFVMSLWAGCYAMESRWQGRKLLGKRIQHQTNKYPRKMVGVNLCTSALFGNSFNLLKHFRDPWKKCDAIWEICDKCTPRIIYWLFILARF